MTKKRLKIMTILDIVLIIVFGFATIASWGVYEKYYSVTYFVITVFLIFVMCDRIYSFKHRSNIKNIKIKYFNDEINKLTYIGGGKSNWIDLRSAETIKLKKGEFRLIPLGVGMKLPEGYEANIVPRSSTYKNFKIIQTNHMGVIDNSYSGDSDQWMMPVIAMEDTIINKNDRICQFRINKIQPQIQFEEVAHLDVVSRGGIGSTGKN